MKQAVKWTGRGRVAAPKPRACIPRGVSCRERERERERGRGRAPTVLGRNVTRPSTRFVRPAGMRGARLRSGCRFAALSPFATLRRGFLARIQLPLIKGAKRVRSRKASRRERLMAGESVARVLPTSPRRLTRRSLKTARRLFSPSARTEFSHFPLSAVSTLAVVH